MTRTVAGGASSATFPRTNKSLYDVGNNSKSNI